MADELLRFLQPALCPKTEAYVVHRGGAAGRGFAGRLIAAGIERATMPAMETSVDAYAAKPKRPAQAGENRSGIAALTFLPPPNTLYPMTEPAYQQCISPNAARRTRSTKFASLATGAAACWTSATTGRGCRCREASAFSSIAGTPREPARRPARFFGRLAIPRAAAVLSHGRRDRHHRRGADRPADRPTCWPADGDEAGQTAASIRGPQSQRQLQGQRHDRRVHPRPDGRGAEGRLRLDRQHQRQPGHVRFAGARCRASSSSAAGRSRFGKLSQALDYGALTLQIQGDFDDCLRRVRQIAVDPEKWACT